MAETSVIEHVYRYPFASALAESGGKPRLALAASRDSAGEKLLFAGGLRQPELAAALLLATSEVALRRYYVPPAMVARILRRADPVVTAADGRLRLESLSQCCGVYARADFLPEMLATEACGKGTMNVDFNPSMRAALARIRDRDGLDLRVTPEEFEVTASRGGAIERKVKLPLRWLKGFAEVQALAAGLALHATLSGPEARRFLSAIPRSVTAKDRTWLAPATGGLRLSQRPDRDAIATAGLGRLQAMKPLARHAEALRVYGSATGTSAFELDFGGARYLLMLSAGAARGFSGEGQLLTALSVPDADMALARVRAALTWQSEISAGALAESLRLPEPAVRSALALLAAQGLVGFDPRDGQYFRRVLPFDLAEPDRLYPRLRDARALSAEGAVALVSTEGDVVEATVQSEGIAHRVRLDGETFRCTCLWHARTRGESGPCKHALAVMIAKGATPAAR
jgi:SWIM zinc finger